ncbi:SDR family oxidoreductase [Methyloterricola oryzae]|uniref:SDR family oxidoreductase n=1 Tax=Methyloterricola oryzae TaxID=1495050 RepID=UPI0005EB9F1F|nr:SDR family oxidoreductase [Methyloterricola oryzae]
MATVLVTGANRGIGLEFCRQYAEAGWKVLACCRNPSAAHELQGLAARHSGVSVHELDVARFGQADTLSAQLGGETIDVLLANAGIYGDHDRHGFGALDYGRWQETMTVNALAPVKLLEAFLPQLQRSERKLMVAITSLMGSMADNRGGGALFYRSSKAALNAAMRTLSIDLRPRGVGFIILHPGWVQTDMGGLQAPTSVTESVAGMRKVIDEFQMGDTGCFVNFRGETLPW